MDKFMSVVHDYCSVGGIHCPCCNPYLHNKQKLRRYARRKLKRVFDESLRDWEDINKQFKEGASQ